MILVKKVVQKGVQKVTKNDLFWPKSGFFGGSKNDPKKRKLVTINKHTFLDHFWTCSWQIMVSQSEGKVEDFGKKGAPKVGQKMAPKMDPKMVQNWVFLGLFFTFCYFFLKKTILRFLVFSCRFLTRIKFAIFVCSFVKFIDFFC